MLNLFSVSMPRAGHHVAEMVLRRLLGDRFAYCEFYTIETCCKSIPCKRLADHLEAGALAFMQKSHDHDLHDVADPMFDGILVQIRDPVARALSNYELDLRTVGAPHSIEYMRYWFGFEAAYSVGFFEKWCLRPDPRSYILKYEELLSDPATYYRQIFERFALPMDAFDADTVVETQQRSSGDGKPFKERDIGTSRYFEPGTLGDFQRLVAEGATALGYRPHPGLRPGQGHSRAVASAFRIRRSLLAGRPKEALARIDAYLGLPDAHPFVRLQRARLLMASGALDAAAADCRAVIEAFPAHPRAYVDLALLLQEQRDIAGAKMALDQCIASTDDPERAAHLILRVFHDPRLTQLARAALPEPMISREDVVAAFRFILGREPEDESVVDAHRRAGSRNELREILLRSEEFTGKYRDLLAAAG